MTPGSIYADLTHAARQARQIGETLSTCAAAVDTLGEKARACLDAAVRNSDGSNTYCIPVEVLDELSSAVTTAGGAS